MADDYQFNFTDTNKTPFVVKPYTFNGYATPDSSPLPSFYTNGSVTAVSANTSLVFVGKGMPDYGDAVQNNFLYLLEHFANDVAPIAPVQGQIWYNTTDGVLYVYDGVSAWNKLIIETSTGLTSDLNLGGFKITNLGDPVVGTDAANLNAVTTAVSTHEGDDTLHLSPSQNALLDGVLATVTSAEINFLDGVTSPIQTQIDGKLSLTGGTLTGNLSMGSNKIVSLAQTLSSDADDVAVTKKYVDDAILGTGTSDGVVNAGSLNPVTGELTLYRSVGTPVVVSGTFAPTSHTQADNTVTHDISLPVSQSYLVGQALDLSIYPEMPVYDALLYLDQAVYDARRHVHRQMLTSVGGTTLTLAANMAYEVNSNKLQLFKNGVKQYANERGSSKIVYYDSIIGLYSETGLTPSTLYSFDITVDGVGPTTISITTPAGTYPFAALLLDVSTALSIAGVPVATNVDQYLDSIKFTFTSLTTGVGSSVTVSYGVGSLFEAITSTYTGDAPTNTAITVDYGYEEVGVPGDTSVVLELATAPLVGDVFEVLVWP